MYPGIKCFVGRKELKRLMQSSFETFKKVCKYHEIPDGDWKLNGQYNFIDFANGSRIDLLDVNYQPSDPMFERFGSTEYTIGWLEEAGEIVFGAFDVLKTRVGRHLNKEYNIHPKVLLTCNPKKNWLKRMVWKPWKTGTLSKKYAYIQSLYSDNFHTADTYGETLSEIVNKQTKQRLQKGNWDYDDADNCLVDNGAISDLFTNHIDGGGKYATLDVARFGVDTCVMKLWEGLRVYKIITWDKTAINVTAEKVKKIIFDEKIPRSRLIIDEDGVGGGVVDLLPGCKGFIANSSVLENPGAKPIRILRNGEYRLATPKDNFKTLKDQCGYLLAQRINDRLIAIDCEDEAERDLIEEEISELKDKDPDSDTKKQLMPKSEIKENIGRSPDHLDCLIMRMYFELSEEPVVVNNFTQNKKVTMR